MYDLNTLLPKLEQAVAEYLDDLARAVDEGDIEPADAERLRKLPPITRELLFQDRDHWPRNLWQAMRAHLTQVWPSEIVKLARLASPPSEVTRDLFRGCIRVVNELADRRKVQPDAQEKHALIQTCDLAHLVIRSTPQSFPDEPESASLTSEDVDTQKLPTPLEGEGPGVREKPTETQAGSPSEQFAIDAVEPEENTPAEIDETPDANPEEQTPEEEDTDQ